MQGTLDFLILLALTKRRMHGSAIAERIGQITRGTFQVKPGSLFPALHRLERAGSLASTWGESETHRRARYYVLTKSGMDHLKIETEEWKQISSAIASAIQSATSKL